MLWIIDSGYYADKLNAQDSDKSGIISFTSALGNLATDFKDCAFGTNDKFGIAMFTTVQSTDDVNKTELDTTISKTEFSDLKDANGYFYSFVKDIETENFDKSVYAIPFAIIDGTTYWGNFTSAAVNSEKWLGDISNSPANE